MTVNDLHLSVMVPIDSEAMRGMTADEMIQRLTEAKDVHALEQQIQGLRNAIHTYGKSLELILDEVNDPFDRAKALRDLVKDMTEDD